MVLPSRATLLFRVQEAGGKGDRNRRMQDVEPGQPWALVDVGLVLFYRVRRLNKDTPGVFRRASLTRDHRCQSRSRSRPLHPQHNLRGPRSRHHR